MYLREVIISGFKSFADRTRIEMGPGVTTIVGPNGCGKSNIVDAIRWVLGEQSAKALRGAKMQDVVFAGTDTRPALKECEVTLIFTDCEAALGTGFHEVEVTRRVSLEGSSHYYLNGKTCRLKDIQQLFMDTGVGRVSYSFMVQGQIDQILSNNAAERRVIFEEAAGITRYKAQRREALNKLGQVEQNFSRVKDVIDEIGRQMGTLKRQASKALRYKRISFRLTHLDLALNAYKYKGLQDALSKLRAQAEEQQGVVSSLRANLEGRESDVESRKLERTEWYERLQSIQQEAYELRSQKDQFENQAELSLIRARDADARVAQIKVELEALVGEMKDLDNKVRDNAQIKELQLNLVDSSDQVFQKKQEEVQAVQKELSEQEGTLRQKKKTLTEAEGAVNRLRTRLTDWEIRLKTDEARGGDLEEKHKNARLAEAVLSKQLTESENELKRQMDLENEALQTLEDVKRKAIELREVFKEVQRGVQTQDRDSARLQAQITILKGLQEKLEGFSDGAKAILTGKLSHVVEAGKALLLMKGIEVAEGYGRLLERLLGQASDAVCVEGWEQVFQITRALAERDLGRACLQFSIRDLESSKPPRLKLPEGIIEAIDVVKAVKASVQESWAQVLQGCYFAESLEDWIGFWQANSGLRFLYVATRDGALIDARGLVYGGSLSDQGGQSSFIEREAEIRALEAQFKAKQGDLALMAEKAREAQEALEEVEGEVEAHRQAVSALSQVLSSARLEVREAQNGITRNRDQGQSTAEQIAKIRQSQEETLAQKTTAESELQQQVNRMEALRAQLIVVDQSITQIREKRDVLCEALSEQRIDLVEKRQRLDLIDQGLIEVDERRRQIEKSRLQKLAELNRLGDQSLRWVQESEQAQLESEELAKAYAERLQALESHKKELVRLESIIGEFEKSLAQERKVLREKESSLKTCELKLTEESSQSHYLLERMRSEYHVELTDVDWKFELWKSDEEFEASINLEDIDEGENFSPRVKHERDKPTEEELQAMEQTDWGVLEQEVNSMRSKMASMGAVNLVAIEEYSGLKERYTFLETQMTDLANSKEQLMAAIEQISQKSQALFVQTFEKVRENFKFTFDALFGGGHADLLLVENEDVLECGVDIIAQPPGTRMKGLTLLSGGQKTMTAVALLFAIYKVKPSPFCVLDELDAPLDDANIGRFTAMLREFTRYSQFLVISHNKRTISASDRLYGVTMQEKGVTRLVSMKFTSEHDEAQATQALSRKLPAPENDLVLA